MSSRAVRRRRIGAVVGAVVVAAVLALWVHGRATADTALVEAGEVDDRIVARAVVVPIDGTAEVRARVDGRVVRVLVREGQTVKAGDLLAEVEPEIIGSEVTRRQAELESLVGTAKSVAQGARVEEQAAAVAELAAAREELSLAESRAARERTLADRGAGSAAAAEEAQRAVAIGKAHVEVADARLRLARAGGRSAEVSSANARVTAARAAVDQARLELDRTRFVAPIDGVVLARRVDPGDVITGAGAGVGAPAFEIADASRTELRMEVEEVDSSRLAPGLGVRVRIAGRNEVLGEGTVDRVGAQLERRTIGAHDARERGEGWVRAAWIAPRWTQGATMPLGQRVEVVVDLPPRAVAARVPRSAVRVRDGRARVEVEHLLGFREVLVELGVADERFVEVRGLAPGERVRR